MSDATVIAVVTIICSAVVSSITLIVRSNVIQLKTTVGEQTKELAKLHQTIIAQSARTYDEEATRRGSGRQPHKMPSDEPYTANPPYRKSSDV
jgi:hypothetical protein